MTIDQDTMDVLEKHFLLKYMLSSNTSVLLLVNNSIEGVDVPEALKKAPSVSLRLGLNMKPPIAFDLDQEKLVAPLLFGNEVYVCVIPLKAVFGVVSDDNQRGPVWRESIPKEDSRKFSDPENKGSNDTRLSVMDGGKPGEGRPKTQTPGPGLALVKPQEIS